MMSAILLVPVGVGVGLGVDYGRLSNAKLEMQTALDAAAWYGATLPLETTPDDRLKKMQKFYTANGGLGTIKVEAYNETTNSLQLAIVGDTQIPMTFMKLARVNQAQIAAVSKVQVPLRLKTATFKVSKAAGWWSKTMVLYGRKDNATTYDALMTITYGGMLNQSTTIQRWVNGKAETAKDGVIDVSEYNSLKMQMNITAQQNALYGITHAVLYSLVDSAGGGLTGITKVLLNNKVEIPLSMMSDDPAFVGRMYTTPVTKNAAGVEKADTTKTKVNDTTDIYKRVGCGVTEQQNWEDGGSLQTYQISSTGSGTKKMTTWGIREGTYGSGEVAGTVQNRDAITDFGYWITGRCDVGGSGARLLN